MNLPPRDAGPAVISHKTQEMWPPGKAKRCGQPIAAQVPTMPAALRPTAASVPELSVVVTITTGCDHLGRCLRALESQNFEPPLEILVPFDPSLDNVEQVRAEHPLVRFVEMAGFPCGNGPDAGLVHLMYDRRRSIGLLAARGEIVAITEDHAIPDERWCASVVAAHRALPCAAIGGAVDFTGENPLNRAVHFCDFGRFENPVPAGPAEYITDVNVSYKRAALEKVRAVWSTLFHETAVHGALRGLAETLWLSPQMVVRHDRGTLRLRPLLRERAAWARVFAGRRVARAPLGTRLLLAAGCFVLPSLLLARSARTAAARGLPVRAILRVLPAIGLLDCAWAWGEFVGYLTARPNRCPAYQKHRFEVPQNCANCAIFQVLDKATGSNRV